MRCFPFDNPSHASGQPGLVSVIVTVFNQKVFLGEALDSIVAQSYRPIECVVVDDGSNDGCDAVVRRYTNVSDVIVRYIRQDNQGAQAARNRGAAASVGEFIQHLDADDVLAPDKLAKHIDFLMSVNGATSDVVYGDAQWLLRLEGQYQAGEGIGIGPTADVLERMLLGDWNPSFSYMYRRSVLASCGGWNPTLTINQDYDFFLRIAAAGKRFSYVPVMTGWYRRHDGPRLSDQSMILRAQTTFRILQAAEAVITASRTMTLQQRNALAQAYRRVSRWAFDGDRPLWRESFRHAMRVSPDFEPASRLERALSRAVGPWHAECVVSAARLSRKLVSRT